MWELLARDSSSKARVGRLTTPHGTVDTPVFMPVGTQGTVKTVNPRELRELGAEIILGNAYHLFVRPGLDVIRRFGGLHRFMNWTGPILSDSGGYQIFSLAKLRRLTQDGVHFQNHVDGTPAFISPEIAIQIQRTLGSDIAMVLDECPPWPCNRDYAGSSLQLTVRWANRCKQAWNSDSPAPNHGSPTSPLAALDHQPSTINSLLFAIVQGSTFDDLRRESAQALVEIGFDGYAIGGVSVGEPEELMIKAVESSEPFLPAEKPRYAMGLGTPPQMLEMIARGIDMFDCVLPTRLARNGTAFTATGTLNLKNAEFAMQTGPIEEGCGCPACSEFSRAYIRHLVKTEEILGLRLITLHNLHFYLDLIRKTRDAITTGSFEQMRQAFVRGYAARPADPGGATPARP